MPPLPPVAGVIKVQLKGTSGEATELPWANVLHCQYASAPPSVGDITGLADNISAFWSEYMAPEQVSNVTLTNIVCTDLSSDMAASIDILPNIAGTRGDDEIPAQVAYLISYPIGTPRYRGGHPRSYLIVGGNADFLDAAHWSSAFHTEVITHWTEFLTNWLHTTYGDLVVTGMCAVSYYGGAPTVGGKSVRRTVPLVYPFDFSLLLGSQQMATQRRRIGRHRR